MITPETPALLTGRALPRRTILRGIGAAIGLPFLEAMSPAMAAGTQGKAPVRMAFFYVPNGIIMDAWNPDYEGPFRELPRALKSLEPYKQDMLQIGNLTHIRGRALLQYAVWPRRSAGTRASRRSSSAWTMRGRRAIATPAIPARTPTTWPGEARRSRCLPRWIRALC